MFPNFFFLLGILALLGGFYYQYQYFHSSQVQLARSDGVANVAVKRSKAVSQPNKSIRSVSSNPSGAKRKQNVFFNTQLMPLPLEENRIYGAVLSDRELIGNALEMLLKNRNTPGRNEYVNFLIQALKWRDNPCRVLVWNALEKTILESKMEPSWTDSERRSWMNGQTKLFLALLEMQPNLAHNVIKRARSDDSLHKMLMVARNYYIDQKRRGMNR